MRTKTPVRGGASKHQRFARVTGSGTGDCATKLLGQGVGEAHTLSCTKVHQTLWALLEAEAANYLGRTASQTSVTLS